MGFVKETKKWVIKDEESSSPSVGPSGMKVVLPHTYIVVVINTTLYENNRHHIHVFL